MGGGWGYTHFVNCANRYSLVLILEAWGEGRG
jgi:hypothetical protein